MKTRQAGDPAADCAVRSKHFYTRKRALGYPTAAKIVFFADMVGILKGGSKVGANLILIFLLYFVK